MLLRTRTHCFFALGLLAIIGLMMGCFRSGSSETSPQFNTTKANMPDNGIHGSCDGLDPKEAGAVELFMKKVVQAFAATDPAALESLEHPGDDPRDKKNSFEFHKTLMENGDKVKSWSARPYSEPDWEIMKLVKYHPAPTVWIDVTLNNEKRDYELKLACSMDAEGRLRSCYYIDR